MLLKAWILYHAFFDVSKEADCLSDQKTKFTQDLLEKLSTQFDSHELQFIEEVITKVLADYDVKDCCTEIVVRDNKNDRLLKRYAACLAVDGKSRKTIDMYIRRLRAFADFIGIHFDEVGTYDIRFYLASLKDTGVSSRTLENYRSYLSAFYQWLLREDFIPKNPCDKIPPIKYKEEVKPPFSDTEVDALRSACNTERERTMVETLISSGVRVEELCSINIIDVDLSRLSIHVKEGKGSKERITYMTEVCAMHLRNYLAHREDDNPALFVSAKKKERITMGGIRYLFKQIGKRAGVDNVHPHRFRRTFATNLARRGMEIQMIAKLMGHSNLQTTMVYVSLDETRLSVEYKKYTV